MRRDPPIDRAISDDELRVKIMKYLESNVTRKPPRPFILAGEMIKELGVRPSEFYTAMGGLVGSRVGEHREGTKRYYYLLKMATDYCDKLLQVSNPGASPTLRRGMSDAPQPSLGSSPSRRLSSPPQDVTDRGDKGDDQ